MKTAKQVRREVLQELGRVKPGTDKDMAKLVIELTLKALNEHVCRNCHKAFRPLRFGAKFCSDRCKVAFHRRKGLKRSGKAVTSVTENGANPEIQQKQ